MKIRLLTLLLAFMAPMLVFGQTFTGTGGDLAPAGSTSGTVTFSLEASGVQGSTLAGGTCASTGVVIPDLAVPAVVGYNTEVASITLTNIQHTWASDLDLVLVGPDGAEYTFNLDNGGSTGLDVATDMNFSSTATDCVNSWTSSTSTVQPINGVQFETAAGVCGPLAAEFTFACFTNSSSIVGSEANGTWTLQVTDDAGGDTGTFDSWSLTFAPMTPADEDSFGTEIDQLACCVDICELTGQEVFNINLEAGECEEIVYYDSPGITGGPSCIFCEDPASPTYAATQDADLVDITLGPDGVTPSQVVVGENGNATFTVTAVEAGTLNFDYNFVGTTFWDPFVITGPAGTIVNNTPLSGSVSQFLNAGEEVSASINSLDGLTDGSSLTLTNFSFLGDNYPCYKLELLSGPAVGEYLPAGSYEAIYEAIPYNVVGGQEVSDPAGALSFTQTINVLEYSGPVQTALACNDHVNISVDENCEITFGADLFLEGGPYQCYDDYEVNIWVNGNENNQTGDVNGVTIPFGDLLGTHTVEIIDPNTGNSCWGTFTAEDKIAPVIECNDYSINCTQNPINSPVVLDLSSVNIITDVSNTGNNSYSVNIPNGFVITDLNVIVDLEITGNQFAWGATITAPNGAELSIWPNGIGGCGTTIDFIADEQAMGGLTCAQFMTGIPSSVINLFTDFGFPYTPLSAVNGSNAQGTWTLNLEGGVDVNEITLVFNNGSGLLMAGTPAEDACGNTTYTFSDVSVDNGCDGEVITRTWYATDASGNESESCVQTINVQSIGIDAVVLPPALVELPCGSGTSPEEIAAYFDNPLTNDIPLSANCQLDVVENHEGYPIAYPHYFQLGCNNSLHPQKVDNSVCNIFATYTDQTLAACGTDCNGNVKVIRTWTLLDWCTSETANFTQLIKAVDDEGPTFILQDITVSTDPWGCAADIDVPMPWELHDNCTDDVDYTVSGPAGVVIVGDSESGYVALNVPKGEHTFYYTAFDCCGNVTTTPATFTVFDGAPPVAVAKQNIVISLTSGATNPDGIAKLYAESVDNGSHDGCTDVHIEVRREDDACDISGNDTYNADGHPQDGSPNPNSPSYDPDGGAYVKFCCDDITNATVDVDGDGELDPGYVQVWLRVWDDGDMDGTFGSDGDNYNETWAFVKVEDKLAPTIVCPPDITITCADDYTDLSVVGSAQGFASCGEIDVEYNDIIVNLNACNEGFVRRRWNVVGRSDIFCDQTITLEAIESTVTVSFSQVGDFTAAGCPDDISVGEPSWIAGPCDVLGYTVDTDTFYFEDGACYKLVNYYTVINWCDYEPNSPTWNGEGIWEHTQIIKVTDETKPVIENCEPEMYAVNDHTDSDNDGNVCEAKVTLTNVATDEGSENCPTSWLKWTVLVDLWGDGTTDLEYSSFLPPFDSQFNDTNGNGIPDVYVAPTANGETVSIPLPDIEGSMSNHKVTWKVTDGCLNNTTCETTFMVVDKKAPTPYCISVSTAVMTMGDNNEPGVEIWASDFNLGSFDNCTDEENLRYTFTATPPQDDPNYDEDLRSSFKTFGCDDVENSPVEVQMYVWDEKDNADFCTVFLTIVDNQELCGTGSRVAGTIETEAGSTVNEVEVNLDSNLPEYPRTALTSNDGAYSFIATNSVDYEVSAIKDVDYLNGVSTLDLVKIQRHILGLESLNSPYKMIAADINADNEIKASDLSQLRKLILGVITDLPTNDSWRFVDAAQALTVDSDLADVEYTVNINNLQADTDNNNFVAVKVGDVTDNAAANLTSIESEVRSNNAVVFTIENREVVAGETVEVEFTSENFANVFGYQFTMELNGLEFANATAGAVNVTDANFGLLRSDVVTVSYNGANATSSSANEAVFTVTFTATSNGNLADMINVTSKVTSAEAYVGESLEIRNVEIATRGNAGEAYTTELYQNEPNPFKGQTVVGFTLAENAPYSITVLDVTGKVIKQVNSEGVKGYNTEIFTADELGTSGVLYYQLESGEFTATKKMIIIE